MNFDLTSLTNEQIVQIGSELEKGEVAIIPTDTIYGIVGSALNQTTVEKIYQLRKRTPEKPMIILIGEYSELKKFGITPNDFQKEIMNKYWPGPVSLILPCPKEELEYLHRGKKSLAFRFPKQEWLQKLLKESGPLVAPSANFEGEPSSTTVAEAKKYFPNLPLYLNAGKLENPASTVIQLHDRDYTILRQGAFLIGN